MELIAAMSIAFLLGAFVRAPFKLSLGRKTGDAEPEREISAKDEEQAKIERQLHNLLNYGGEER